MRRNGTFNVTIVPHIREGRTVEYGDFIRFLKILKTFTFTTRKLKPTYLPKKGSKFNKWMNK